MMIGDAYGRGTDIGMQMGGESGRWGKWEDGMEGREWFKVDRPSSL